MKNLIILFFAFLTIGNVLAIQCDPPDDGGGVSFASCVCKGTRTYMDGPKKDIEHIYELYQEGYLCKRRMNAATNVAGGACSAGQFPGKDRCNCCDAPNGEGQCTVDYTDPAKYKGPCIRKEMCEIGTINAGTWYIPGVDAAVKNCCGSGYTLQNNTCNKVCDEKTQVKVMQGAQVIDCREKNPCELEKSGYKIAGDKCIACEAGEAAVAYTNGSGCKKLQECGDKSLVDPDKGEKCPIQCAGEWLKVDKCPEVAIVCAEPAKAYVKDAEGKVTGCKDLKLCDDQKTYIDPDVPSAKCPVECTVVDAQGAESKQWLASCPEVAKKDPKVDIAPTCAVKAAAKYATNPELKTVKWETVPADFIIQLSSYAYTETGSDGACCAIGTVENQKGDKRPGCCPAGSKLVGGKCICDSTSFVKASVGDNPASANYCICPDGQESTTVKLSEVQGEADAKVKGTQAASGNAQLKAASAGNDGLLLMCASKCKDGDKAKFSATATETQTGTKSSVSQKCESVKDQDKHSIADTGIRMALSTLMSTFMFAKASNYQKYIDQADASAKILREKKAAFDSAGGLYLCRPGDRDNPDADVSCYCYLENGGPNPARGKSEKCQRAFLIAQLTYTASSYGNSGMNKLTGCFTKEGQFDGSCQCKTVKNATGENFCFELQPTDYQLPGLGTASWASQMVDPANQITSGKLSPASLDAATLKNQAQKMRDFMKKQQAAVDPNMQKQMQGMGKAAGMYLDKRGDALDLAQSSRAGSSSSSGQSVQQAGQDAILSKAPESMKKEVAAMLPNYSTSKNAKSNAKKSANDYGWAFGGGADGSGVKVEEVMEKQFNYKENDINKNSSADIFKIITNRYQRSGLRRLFDDEHKAESDAAGSSDINTGN